MTDLLECPFCGNTDMDMIAMTIRKQYIARIICTNCNLAMTSSASNDNDAIAKVADKWNTRYGNETGNLEEAV